MEFLRRDDPQPGKEKAADKDGSPPRGPLLPPLSGSSPQLQSQSPPTGGIACLPMDIPRQLSGAPEPGAPVRRPSNAASISSSSSLSSGGTSSPMLRSAASTSGLFSSSASSSATLQRRRPSNLRIDEPHALAMSASTPILESSGSAGSSSGSSGIVAAAGRRSNPISPPLRSAADPDSPPDLLKAGSSGGHPAARTGRRKPASDGSLGSAASSSAAAGPPASPGAGLSLRLAAPASATGLHGRRLSQDSAIRPALSVGPDLPESTSPASLGRSRSPSLTPLGGTPLADYSLKGVSPRRPAPSSAPSAEEREADLRSRLNQSSEENASLRGQRDALMKELQGFYRTRASLEEDLEKTRVELQRTRERCEELSRQLEAARAELGTVRREADLLRELNREVQERSSENEYLAQLLEESIAPVFLLDDAGKVVLWSKCMEQCTGYTRDEAVGRSFVDVFVSDESREFVREKIAETSKENMNPNMNPFTYMAPPSPLSSRLQSRLHPVQFEFTAVVKEDPEGGRRQSYAEEGGEVGTPGPGIAGLFSRIETPPTSLTNIAGGGGASDAGGSRRSSSSAGRPRTFGAGASTPSGTSLHVPVELLVTATRHAGRGRVPSGVCCIGQDLSEKQRAVSLLLGSISHECKTPLHHIVSCVQLMLQRCSDDPEQSEYLRIVESSSTHLLKLINAILEYARVESGAIALHEVPMDVHALVEDVASASAPGAQAKGLELSVHVDSAKVPRFAVGDSDKIRQVLLNLVSNAVKCTYAGEVSVAVTAAAAAAGAGPAQGEVSLSFTVSDTGMGIKASDRGKLFRFFSQLDMTLGKTVPGTGLGLAISHRLVRRMGGSITVASDEGKGSVFTVTVPLRTQRGPPAAPRQRLELCAAVWDAAPWAAAAVGDYLRHMGAHVHEIGVEYDDSVDAVLCGLAPNEADPAAVLPAVQAAREASCAGRVPCVVMCNLALLGDVHARIRASNAPAAEAAPGSPGPAEGASGASSPSGPSPISLEGDDGAGDWAGVFVVSKPVRYRDLEAAMRRAAAWLHRHPAARPAPRPRPALASAPGPRPEGSAPLPWRAAPSSLPLIVGTPRSKHPAPSSHPSLTGAVRSPSGPASQSGPLGVPRIGVSRPKQQQQQPLNVERELPRARSASADDIVPQGGIQSSLAPPAAAGRHPSPRRASAPESATAAPRRRPSRVLIADDNPINVKLLRRFLEKEGYDCVSVVDGNESVDAFVSAAASAETQFDAVLMDLYMPLCTGYEATSRIRAWESDQLRARTPIIACTANVLPGDRDSVIAAGMDDLITKPLRTAHLYEVLKRWTGVAAAERERRASEGGSAAGIAELGPGAP